VFLDVENYCLVLYLSGVIVLLLSIDLILEEVLLRHAGGAASTVVGQYDSAYV
jgi:hypothetical protein